MPPRKTKRTIEWVGGLLKLPDHFTADLGIPPPEGLLWLGADGALLGEFSVDAGGWGAIAVDSLRSTIARPMMGRSHRPDRVRVESPELAQILRAGQSEIEVVCAPTPELDAVVAAMIEQLAAAARPSYLSLDAGPVEVGDLCQAAADFYRAKPWKKVLSDQDTFAVDIPELGLRDAVVSIIGQEHPVPGLILFATLADFDAHSEALAALFMGRQLRLPPHVALSYSTAAEMMPELREEIDRYGWPVASRSAYPMVVVLDAELRAGPPTATHLLHLSAIARALVKALEHLDVLRAAWKGGTPYARAFRVPTAMRDVEVQLRAPYPRATPRTSEDPRGLLAALAQVGLRQGELDPEVRGPLEDELLRQFADSPEAKAIPPVEWCPLLMDLAAGYCDATIATLSAPQLREVVFELIPRKLSAPASVARSIIDEYRALYAFLGRAGGLAQADECLHVLGRSAPRDLQAAMSDRSKFGMAKSLLMDGLAAGFDGGSGAGLDAFLRRALTEAGLPAPPKKPGKRRQPTAKAPRAKPKPKPTPKP